MHILLDITVSQVGDHIVLEFPDCQEVRLTEAQFASIVPGAQVLPRVTITRPAPMDLQAVATATIRKLDAKP